MTVQRRTYRPGTHISPRGIRVVGEWLEEGVRRLDGHERFKLPAGVAEAAVLDERPPDQFLTALILDGLEMWRKNRQNEKANY